MKYHVTPSWDGENLESLAQRSSDDDAAVETFCNNWPGASDAAWDHIHWIFLYATLAQAQEHAKAYGGEILIIDDEYLEIEVDPYEDELFVRDEIDAEYISKL